MLAPNELVATSPSTPSAAAVSRVVVVLPLVPEINAILRPTARLASRFGSIMSPILPPMTAPSPRPVARDRAAALRETEVASFDRSGFFWLTGANVSDSGSKIRLIMGLMPFRRTFDDISAMITRILPEARGVRERAACGRAACGVRACGVRACGGGG